MNSSLSINSGDDVENPASVSVRKVLSQCASHHSFQGRLEDYHSVFDDDYDDRDVAESKTSTPRTPQRKSFDDGPTQPATNSLGSFAKSSSALSDMSLDSPSKPVAENKSSHSISASGFGSKMDSPGSSSRFYVARPHHLPKMDGLSGSLEKIRKSLGDEVSLCNLHKNLFILDLI